MDFSKLKSQLESSNKIVITSHKSPDGDAVGSSLALGLYLKKIGKQVSYILPDAAPKFLTWMNDYEEIKTFESSSEECKQLIEDAEITFVLDYNDLKRVDQVGELIEQSSSFVAMIDHHLHPKEFANWMYSDTNSCSTAQMIYETIEGLGDESLLDQEIAEGIYVGIVTDSGSFRFPSVKSRTHDIASKLIGLGLVHNEIHENLFDVNTLDRLKLMGYALSEKLRVLPNIPVAVISLSKEELDRLCNKKGSTEGLVNYALSIEGVKMAAFIKEDIGKVKMSFRSKGDVPVNEFSAAHFSGGGHKNAAGGICFDSLEDTIAKFEKEVYEFWKD